MSYKILNFKSDGGVDILSWFKPSWQPGPRSRSCSSPPSPQKRREKREKRTGKGKRNDLWIEIKTV